MRTFIVVRALAWLLLGPALVVAAMAVAPGEAEAGRRVIRGGAAATMSLMRNRNRGEDKADEASTPSGGEEATPGNDAPTDNAPQPARAAVAVVPKPAAPAKPAEIEVAGCAAGNFCIVCLAGCTGDVDGIVSSVAKLGKN